MKPLKVNEIYGPTVQGEGPSTGQQCAFLRLTGCNLTCSWCDTPYTWDWKGLNGTVWDQASETKLMDPDEVWERLRLFNVPLIVISGGEPMMQQEALQPLVQSLVAQGLKVEIETNGTIVPTIKPSRFNVSPKLTHSGVLRKKAIKPETLREYVPNGIFKFVCQQESDLDEVREVADEAGIPDAKIWIMPEGRDPKTLMSHAEAISDETIRRGWNITPRLHVMTWGNRRGI